MSTTARKRRLVKGVAFVLVFVAIGVVIGVGATLLLMKGRMHRVAPNRDAIVSLMLEKMRERVSVTEEESARLAGLLEAHFDEILAVREQSFRSMQEVFRRIDADTEAVLGPERFKVWYEHKERGMARWRRRYERAPEK